MALDAEILGFIAETDAFYADGPVLETVSAQRAAYDRMAAAFQSPRPAGVSVEEDAVALAADATGPARRIPVRRYMPERAAGPTRVVYFHGGGFVVGGLDSHDDLCAEIADACGLTTIAVDYRLAPEHPHPAGYLDGLGVARALGVEGPTLLAGDSVGGALAAAAALELRGGPAAPLGQVLIYPGLGGQPLALASYRDHAEAPLLRLDELNHYYALRAGGTPDYRDFRFAPTAAAAWGLVDLAGVAPCAAFPVSHDPLCDDSELYVAQLRAAGVAARLHRGEGLVHGCFRARARSRRARAYIDAVFEAIRALAQPG